MKKTTILTSAAGFSAACLGAGLLAVSAAAAPPRGDGFERLDTNGDGRVTQAEMSARQTEMFEKADANNDGGVTAEEMAAYKEAKRAEMREKLNPDTNDDGLIDRIEFVEAAEARFDRLDKNDDGVLSEDERPRRQGRHRHGGRGD